MFHQSCYHNCLFFIVFFVIFCAYLMKINGYFGIFLYVLNFKRMSVLRRSQSGFSKTRFVKSSDEQINNWFLCKNWESFEKDGTTCFGLVAAPLPTTGRETASSIIVATMRLQPPRSMHNSSTVINNSKLRDPGGNYPVLTVCGNSAYGNP